MYVQIMSGGRKENLQLDKILPPTQNIYEIDMVYILQANYSKISCHKV